jgi:hypothetical protein
MEAIAESIIDQWKTESGSKANISLSSVEVKHQDHDAGVYTLYFNTSYNEIVKIKAIKDSHAWKIIEMK